MLDVPGEGIADQVATQTRTSVPLPETMGAKEAAECLGVKPPNLYTTRGVPKAVKWGEEGCEVAQQLASGPVYQASAIRALAAERQRKANGDAG